MKKYFSFLLATVAAGMTLVSCEGPNAVKPDPVGETYPRVQLIEHFTGAACGYCPYGMDLIYEVYSKDADNMVWVSNHYGYKKDEYTIDGSTTIGKKLKVSGAPGISLNRAKYDGGYSYHPAYISEVYKNQAKTATSCVLLEATYNEELRSVHVKATMKTTEEELTGVKLTIGLTESGMLGKQADYTGSWAGWDEFIHTHTIRWYATEPLGDEFTFKNRVATAEYDIVLENGWVAENCEVVAWIPALGTDYPVLNAAKTPAVTGTAGGEDIKHGGVTATPVKDTYPESGAPKNNLTFTKASLSIKNGIASVMLASDTVLGTTDNLDIFPLIELFFVTTANNLPYGTYNVSADKTENTVVAGYRDDENIQLDGSLLYYCVTYQGKTYIEKQWMISGGSVTVAEDALTIDITTKNGSVFQAVYNGDINAAAANAPAALPAKHMALPMLKEDAPAFRPLYF